MVIACELTPAFSKDSGEPGYEAEEEDRLNAEEARYPPGERLLQEMLADQVCRMQAKYPMLGRTLRRSHHAARCDPEEKCDRGERNDHRQDRAPVGRGGDERGAESRNASSEDADGGGVEGGHHA